jgi:hypothetical protein
MAEQFEKPVTTDIEANNSNFDIVQSVIDNTQTFSPALFLTGFLQLKDIDASMGYLENLQLNYDLPVNIAAALTSFFVGELIGIALDKKTILKRLISYLEENK